MTNVGARDALPELELSLFQKILLSTDGTVTQLLELHTGQAVQVHKLEQTIVNGAPAQLQADAHEAVLHRTILLRNARQNLLYADSYFVVSRMPAAMQQPLLHSDRPIGLLWREQRLETYREIIACGSEPMGALAEYFALHAEELLLSRTYLIHHRQLPLGIITEKFPLDYFKD